MDSVQLTDSIAVSAQISVDDISQIAAAGYKVLINNRPDGEENAQPTSALIAAAAAAAGMEYHYLPVTAVSFPGPNLDDIRNLFDDPKRPVFAFCRSGTRCANLWVAGFVSTDCENAIHVAGQRGFDLAMALKFIAHAEQG